MLDFHQRMATKLAREIMEEHFGSFNLAEPEHEPVLEEKAKRQSRQSWLFGFFFAKRDRQRPATRRETAIEANCGR